MKSLAALVLFSLFTTISRSQSLTWSKSYGGSQEDMIYASKATSDGGVVSIG